MMYGIIRFQRMIRAIHKRDADRIMSEFILSEIKECKEVDARHTIRRFLVRCISNYRVSALIQSDQYIAEQRDVHHVVTLLGSMTVM
jgi:hypothetical protein